MRRSFILVSGGQTGVDRAALRFAVKHGWTYRGWAPAGGWAEDCPTPPGVLALYPLLRETETDDPRHRTSLNVEESDAVLVISPGVASPGTAWAVECATAFGKPVLQVAPDAAAETIRAWLHQVEDLAAVNIVGPRESEAPGIEDLTLSLLERVLHLTFPNDSK